MTKDLLKEIQDALDDRQEWAETRDYCYKMRNGGLKRIKPFPGASDVRYSLGDEMIDKLKASYVDQMYGGENMAGFVALRQQDQELTSSVAAWFDYQLKQKTNFEEENISAIDQMEECAFAPVKVYWNADLNALCFDQRDPLHIIVPTNAVAYNGPHGCDWLVDILHMSVSEYKANPNFVQGEDLIKRIKGKGSRETDDQTQRDSADLVEGINCSANENEIVLWEVYKRDRIGKKITVETISPLLPDESNVIRAEFALPYNEGCFANGRKFPFYRIRYEIKNKGYYAGRGVIQQNAPYEATLTGALNTWLDHLAFSSRPNFEQTGASVIPTGKNFRTSPGSILPPGLKMAQHPEPPQALLETMQMIRGIAEAKTQIPDLGLNQHIAPQASKDATATQVNAVMAQSTQGSGLKARIYRKDLAEGFHMAWSLYIQYAGEDCFQYIQDGSLKQLDRNAFHGDYEIQPNGSADNWNKAAEIQKRLGFYQTFIVNPFANKAEMTKWTWEAFDPRLIKRMFVDPGDATKDQEEDQAGECLLMKEGFAPRVKEADDDKAHLMNLAQFAENKLMRVQMTPELARLVLQHGQEHMMALQNKKDPAVAQIQQQLGPLIQILTQVAQQPDPPTNNVVSMMQPQPGANQTGNTQAPQPPAAATASPSSLQPQMQ